MPELRERVRRKNTVADQICNYLVSRRFPKRLLAGTEHQGSIVGLASWIHFDPDDGDFPYLASVADKAATHHVRYRVVMALGKLFEARVATPADVPEAERILRAYDAVADPPLKNKIADTRSLINAAVRRPESTRERRRACTAGARRSDAGQRATDVHARRCRTSPSPPPSHPRRGDCPVSCSPGTRSRSDHPFRVIAVGPLTLA